MDTVVEVDKIREIVDSRPLDRLSVSPALPERLKIRTIGKNLGMTIHASLGRRDAGKR
jgi:hypothetical protein